MVWGMVVSVTIYRVYVGFRDRRFAPLR
jgi:hypothetical protein